MGRAKGEIGRLEEFLVGEAGTKERLFSVVGGLALLRQDVAYRQELVRIGGLLLMELGSEYRTFTALVSLITTTPLYSFFTDYALGINMFLADLKKTLKTHHFKLFNRLNASDVSLRNLLVQWVTSLFTDVLEVDTLLAVWDLLFLKNASLEILSQICLGFLLVRAPSMETAQPATQLFHMLTRTKLTFAE